MSEVLNKTDLDGLANRYSLESEKALQQKAARNEKLAALRNTLKQSLNNGMIQLGDDSRVDEAIMVGFISSIFGDINKAITQLQLYRLEAQNRDDQDVSDNYKKQIEKIKQGKESALKIEKLTKLSIEKRALEKELAEKSLSAATKEKYENKLLKISKEFSDLVDFFEFSGEQDMLEKLKIKETEWYGAEGADVLNKMRDGSFDLLEQSIEDIASSGFNAEEFKNIMNTLALNGTDSSLETLSTNSSQKTTTEQL